MKHFTLNELTRSSTAKQYKINNTPTPEVTAKLTQLVSAVLDPARATLGAPIRVNSGYRSPALNSKLQGAPTSQHIKGEAADLTTGTKEGNRQLFEIIRDTLEFDQLINEKDFSWVHVSYRKGNNRMQTLKIG